MPGRPSCSPPPARTCSSCAEDAEPGAVVDLAEANGGAITLVLRAWRDDDLDERGIAVADAHDRQDAARFAAAARSRGVLVNVIDQPAFCDFQFGTIVNRSPVVIGISTDGGAPILGQAIRRRIEAVLPASLGAWGDAAKAVPRAAKTHRCPRRHGAGAFWEKFVDVTFISQAEEDAQLAELERLAREIAGREAAAAAGRRGRDRRAPGRAIRSS